MTPWLDDGDVRLYHGDALNVLRSMPDESVDCVVTSPPYWGLRDYGTGSWDGGDPDCDHKAPAKGGPHSASTLGPKRDGLGPDNAAWAESKREHQYTDSCGKCGATRTDQQLGLEPTPDQFVQNMVAVFREVRRVLAPHGTCWVNLGDSYVSNGFYPDAPSRKVPSKSTSYGEAGRGPQITKVKGLKTKDLVGIPWRVAFALQTDGWYLRSDIVWAKPNPMPESVTDRPTKSHEYVFLLTKQPRYWFDAEAVREPVSPSSDFGNPRPETTFASTSPDAANDKRIHMRLGNGSVGNASGRNVRSVWQIATQPYPEAHFATFPEELARRCVLAGCPVRVCRVCGKPSERIVERERVYDHTTTQPTALRDRNDLNGGADGHDVRHGPTVRTETLGWSDCGHNNWRPGQVLDPFIGSGTVAKVARDHGRHAVGIDLNEQYLQLAARRLQQLSLLNQ